jgi:hypothetical protein
MVTIMLMPLRAAGSFRGKADLGAERYGMSCGKFCGGSKAVSKVLRG